MFTVFSFTLILILEIALELLFILLFPLIYPILKLKDYLPAIQPDFTSTHQGILIHAASVGEVNALQTLVQRLLQRYQDRQITLTTTTVTGLKAASGIDPKLQTGLSVLDLWHLRHKQLKQLDPSIICIMETEIWFNLLAFARIHKIPVVFMNARLSEKSLRRYRLFQPLLKMVSPAIKEIMAQSEADAVRFKQLFSSKVSLAGNLKFALDLPSYDPPEIRQSLAYSLTDFVLVWGSSRPGEEALILSILPELKNRIPGLKLIIALRHPQRLSEVLRLLPDQSYSLSSKHEPAGDIHVIDELGYLNQVWAICDLAIVGGSFFDFGGHNPLEPAFYSKAIIMGPYHSSCRDSVNLLNGQNAIRISDVEALAEDILKLAHDPELRARMGAAAKTVLDQNAMSLEKHLNGIAAWME